MIHITGQDFSYNQDWSLFFIVHEVVWWGDTSALKTLKMWTTKTKNEKNKRMGGTNQNVNSRHDFRFDISKNHCRRIDASRRSDVDLWFPFVSYALPTFFDALLPFKICVKYNTLCWGDSALHFKTSSNAICIVKSDLGVQAPNWHWC